MSIGYAKSAEPRRAQTKAEQGFRSPYQLVAVQRSREYSRRESDSLRGRTSRSPQVRSLAARFLGNWATRAGAGERPIPGRWRRGWDSNPRYAHAHNGFRDRPDRPLRHPSAIGVLAPRPGPLWRGRGPYAKRQRGASGLSGLRRPRPAGPSRLAPGCKRLL